MASRELLETANVLLVDNRVRNRRGGGQIFADKLYDWLRSYTRFQIHYLNLTAVENHPINRYLLNTVEKYERILEKRSRNPIVRDLISISQHPLVRFRLNLETRCLRNRRYDLVICNDPLDLKMLIDGKPDVRKLVFILHDPESANILRGRWKRMQRIFDMSNIMREAISQYDTTLVALNKFDYNELQKTCAARVLLIHNGIDWGKFAPGPMSRKENLFLYVGRLEETQKNISLLIQSFYEMRRKDYKLVLIGDGPSRPLYEQMIKFYNLEGFVSLLGFVDETIKIDHYRRAKIFVTPSVSESFAATTLEAMACGLPPISVRNKGALDVINDGVNGYLVDNDASELTNRMLAIASNEDLREYLGRNALRTVREEFGDDVMRVKYLSLFASLLEDGKN